MTCQPGSGWRRGTDGRGTGMIAERFAKEASRSFFAVRDTVPGVLDFLESYKPSEPDQPWFRTR